MFLVLFSCAVCPCPQDVSSSSGNGGCLSRCFSNYGGYFCRYWGSNAVQSKTEILNDQYMLCVLPPPDYVVKYCARLTSCGQCSAHLHCGWCDNTCVHKSKASNCTSYTSHVKNCPGWLCLELACTRVWVYELLLALILFLL